MRPTGLLMLALASSLLFGSCKKELSREPVAGIFALEGQGQLRRGKAWKRTAKPGMMLAGDMTLALGDDARAVLEGLNGVLVALDEGGHVVGRIDELGVKPAEKRRVYQVTDKAEPREVGPLITRARYEPLQSGKTLPEGDTELSDNMAYFFGPGDKKGPPPAHHVAPPPPWVMDKKYVHALRRPLEKGDGTRRLVSAEGFVVVEFRDRATAFADKLELPLDLHDVARVVVLDGSAELALPGGALELDDGEEAEIH